MFNLKLLFVTLAVLCSYVTNSQAVFEANSPSPDAIYLCSATFESNTFRLAVFDPINGSAMASDVAILDEAGNANYNFIGGLTFNSDNELFALAYGDGEDESDDSDDFALNLIQIDPVTGLYEVVVPLILPDGGGDNSPGPEVIKISLAFDRNDNLYTLGSSFFIFDGGSPDLFQIDYTDGTCSVAANLSFGGGDIQGQAIVSGLELNPTDGLIYALADFQVGDFQSRSKMPFGFGVITYDPSDDDVEFVSVSFNSGEIFSSPFTDLVFDPNGEMYSFSFDPGNEPRSILITYDELIGNEVEEAEVISGLGMGTIITAAALSRPELSPAVVGQVYVTTGNNDGSRLATLSPATGEVSPIGRIEFDSELGPGFVRKLHGLAINQDGEIWLTGRPETEIDDDDIPRSMPTGDIVLARVDPATGDVVSIFELLEDTNTSDIAPIEFGDDETLYGLVDNILVTIDLSSGNTTPVPGIALGNSDLIFYGMANDPGSDIIYLYGAAISDGGTTTHSIFSFDEETGMIVNEDLYGGLPQFDMLADIFFDADGNFYGTGTGDLGAVYTINIMTETFTEGAQYSGFAEDVGLPGAALAPPPDDPGPGGPGGAVPTMSQWGLMILGLLMLIFGVVAVRQYGIKTASESV